MRKALPALPTVPPIGAHVESHRAETAACKALSANGVVDSAYLLLTTKDPVCSAEIQFERLTTVDFSAPGVVTPTVFSSTNLLNSSLPVKLASDRSLSRSRGNPAAIASRNV